MYVDYPKYWADRSELSCCILPRFMALYTSKGGCAEEEVIMLHQKFLPFITADYFHQSDIFTKIFVCRYHLV